MKYSDHIAVTNGSAAPFHDEPQELGTSVPRVLALIRKRL